VYGQTDGIDSVPTLHSRDGSLDDPGRHPSPTGMNESNAMPLEIGQVYRNAIRGRHREKNTCRRGHETVGIAHDEQPRAGSRVDSDDVASVHLAPNDRRVHSSGAGQRLEATCNFPRASARRETEVRVGAGAVRVGNRRDAGYDPGRNGFPVHEAVARKVQLRRDFRLPGQELSSTRSMRAPSERSRSSIRSYPLSI